MTTCPKPIHVNPVTATLVNEKERQNFLPNFFGEGFYSVNGGPSRPVMVLGESLVYYWLDNLAEDYNGGFWHFYKLSNGGFYMAPDLEKSLRISVYGNCFEGDLSPDAAGIVATLFALGNLAGAVENDNLRFSELYHLLLSFVPGHPEGHLICRAID